MASEGEDEEGGIFPMELDSDEDEERTEDGEVEDEEEEEEEEDEEEEVRGAKNSLAKAINTYADGYVAATIGLSLCPSFRLSLFVSSSLGVSCFLWCYRRSAKARFPGGGFRRTQQQLLDP
jgi:hypothetical protein